jgi:lysyl-tRNA synthetase class 1
MPDAARALGQDQRVLLAALAERVAGAAPTSGDGWQSAIFDAARTRDVKPGRAFEAIYRAFLGRPNGPRAGWVLASLDAGFVVRRLREAAGDAVGAGA